MSRKRSCCQNSTLMFAGRKDAPRKATRSGTRLRNSVRNHFTALTTQPSRSLFSHSVACCSVSNTLRIIPRFTATVSPNFAGSRRGTWITYANADESCAQRQSCGFLSRRIHCSRSAPCPWGFPRTFRPSSNILSALCRTTAPSISRKACLASCSENSPSATTLRRPERKCRFCRMLILYL